MVRARVWLDSRDRLVILLRVILRLLVMHMVFVLIMRVCVLLDSLERIVYKRRLNELLLLFWEIYRQLIFNLINFYI